MEYKLGERVGVEVEFLSPYRVPELAGKIYRVFEGSYSVHDYIGHSGYKRTCAKFETEEGTWKLMQDMSVKDESDKHAYGLELISPPLTDLSVLKNKLDSLKNLGCYINDTAGCHIHWDAPESVKVLLGILKTFCKMQDDLPTIHNIPKYRLEKYCKKFPPKFIEELETLTAEDIINVPNFIIWYARELKESIFDVWGNGMENPRHPSRYYMLNYHSMVLHETIEFRLFNSTLEYSKVKQYVDWTRVMFKDFIELEEKERKP